MTHPSSARIDKVRIACGPLTRLRLYVAQVFFLLAALAIYGLGLGRLTGG